MTRIPRIGISIREHPWNPWFRKVRALFNSFSAVERATQRPPYHMAE